MTLNVGNKVWNGLELNRTDLKAKIVKITCCYCAPALSAVEWEHSASMAKCGILLQWLALSASKWALGASQAE